MSNDPHTDNVAALFATGADLTQDEAKQKAIFLLQEYSGKLWREGHRDKSTSIGAVIRGLTDRADASLPVAGFYGEDLKLIDTADEYPFTVPEGTRYTLVLAGGSSPAVMMVGPGAIINTAPYDYCGGSGWYSPHGGEYGGRRCPNKCEIR